MPTDLTLEICRRLKAVASQVHVVQTPEDQDQLTLALLEFRRIVTALVQKVDTTDVILDVRSPAETIELCIADLMKNSLLGKEHQLETLEELSAIAEVILFGLEGIRSGVRPDADESGRLSGVRRKNED